MRHVRGLAYGLLCSILQVAAAGAQERVQPPAEYGTAIDEALAEYDAENFEEARALFARAHDLYPNARTLRGLGMVEFERRNYRMSADYLTRALASTVRPLEGELRTETEALLERAKGFLGEVRLEVQPATRPRVLIDGTPIQFEPGTSVILQVGDHTIEVQAEGYHPEKRAITVKGGEQQALRIVLRTPAKSVNDSNDPGIWPWVVVGTGGAITIAGGALIALAHRDIAEVEDAATGTRWSAVERAYDAAPATSTAGFVLAGVGTAAIAGGLLWYFVATGGEDAQLHLSTDLRSVTAWGWF